MKVQHGFKEEINTEECLQEFTLHSEYFEGTRVFIGCFCIDHVKPPSNGGK